MSLKQGDPIENIILHQGEAKVDIVYMWQENPDVVAIGIQTEERCVVDGSSVGDDEGPGVMFSVGGSDGDMTHVVFPQYIGWTVWSADASKYTIHVCLTRD